MAVLDRKELEQSPLSDLHAIASELGIEGFRLLRREKLIDAILGDSSSSDDDGGGEEERPRRRRSRGGRGRKTPEAWGDAGADAKAEKPDEPEPEPEQEDEPGEVRSGVLDILPNG